jgi:hypothetical protein
MKVVFAGSALAATVILGSAAFAQSTATPPAQQPPAATAPQESPAEQVTLVGCVQSEEDYRKAHNLGKGGAVGTGVGAGNEFVLISAMKMPAAGATAGTTGTAGAMAPGTDAFELSGDKESELKAFVGKRVEIMGKMKAAETSATGKPTGGATAGTPPTGVDVASKDLKLREVDIVSIKEATGTCAAAVK